MKTRILFTIIVLFSISFSSLAETPCKKDKKITILVTDSGLGGLSVVADIAQKLETLGYYKKVNLIFANALFKEGAGYNSLSSRDEKISKFSQVLYGMEKAYKPDIILIACNTLSVIYEDTNFAKNTNTDVVGIVDFGVNLIQENLEKTDNSKVVIFGTETTISENNHKKELLKRNVDENKILTKPCPQLQSYIERDPNGDDADMLISIYMEEALEDINKEEDNIFVSLNCSHFGYSESLWKSSVELSNAKLAGILNPNERMASVVMPNKYMNRFKKTSIDIQVVSKVKIAEQNKNSMISIFSETCPQLSKAIDSYHLRGDLF